MTEVIGTPNWSVKDPLDTTTQIVDLPLSLLQLKLVLLQQLETHLNVKTELVNRNNLPDFLKTSFVSPLNIDNLKIENVAAGTKNIIQKLMPVHLDRLIRFINIKKSTDLSIEDLDLLLKSQSVSESEPLRYDLKRLVETGLSISTKQKDLVVNYFARLYKQDVEIVSKVLGTLNFEKTIPGPSPDQNIPILPFTFSHLLNFGVIRMKLMKTI